MEKFRKVLRKFQKNSKLQFIKESWLKFFRICSKISPKKFGFEIQSSKKRKENFRERKFLENLVVEKVYGGTRVEDSPVAFFR